MQRSSETIGAIAAALAKAQIELINPEKSLTATIRSPLPHEGNRTFRYASLANGLELVRKSLGQHEIATVQTTSLDDATGLIRLTTTLAHSSGEWVSSDWPVCPVSETTNPQRMGAALTYARRYALFTLVGIAGEDDLDAPDLNAELDGPLPFTAGSDQPVQRENVAAPNAAPASSRRKPVRPLRVILAPENSQALRQHLIAELGQITEAETLTAWAGKSLPQKNKLATSDAEAVEIAFAAKLTEIGGDGTAKSKKLRVRKNRSEPNGNGSATGVALHPTTPGKPGGDPDPTRENGFAEPVPPEPAAEQSVNPIGKTLRLRDRDHLRFVTTLPCLACGRSPSDAHHLRFAQGRAMGRRVSDEFTVPLCRTHHRELHQRGDERTWWVQLNVDPMLIAERLWKDTHSSAMQLPADEARGSNGGC